MDAGIPLLFPYYDPDLDGTTEPYPITGAAMVRGDVLVVRYEDLRSDTAETLKKVTVLMGEDFSDDEIAEAVSFGSFDNLRKLETSGFFRRGGMRLVNANDPVALSLASPTYLPYSRVNNENLILSFSPATEADAQALQALLPEGEITDAWIGSPGPEKWAGFSRAGAADLERRRLLRGAVRAADGSLAGAIVARNPG